MKISEYIKNYNKPQTMMLMKKYILLTQDKLNQLVLVKFIIQKLNKIA